VAESLLRTKVEDQSEKPDRLGASAGSGGSINSDNSVARSMARRRMRPPKLRLCQADLKPRGFWARARIPHRSLPVLLQLFIVLIAGPLVACSTSGTRTRDAARQELLQTLRQCLLQVSIHNGKEGYQSPCAREDLSTLDGIPRSQLIAALGPAQFCISPTGGDFPKNDDCPADQNPQWSFYRLPQSVYTGGGPDLACESDKSSRCVHVLWRSPK
jgi:hypothetical protein